MDAVAGRQPSRLVQKSIRLTFYDGSENVKVKVCVIFVCCGAAIYTTTMIVVNNFIMLSYSMYLI